MTQGKTDLRISISPKGWHYFLLGVVLTLLAIGGVSACYQGRDIARVTGRPVRIDLPSDVTSYEQIVTISFHKNDKGETLKDVTYYGCG